MNQIINRPIPERYTWLKSGTVASLGTHDVIIIGEPKAVEGMTTWLAAISGKSELAVQWVCLVLDSSGRQTPVFCDKLRQHGTADPVINSYLSYSHMN
jgi:hypothetical protein